MEKMIEVGVLKCNCGAENSLPLCSIIDGVRTPDKIYSKPCGFCGVELSRENYAVVAGGKECTHSYDGYHVEGGRMEDEGYPLNYTSQCRDCGQMY